MDNSGIKFKICSRRHGYCCSLARTYMPNMLFGLWITYFRTWTCSSGLHLSKNKTIVCFSLSVSPNLLLPNHLVCNIGLHCSKTYPVFVFMSPLNCLYSLLIYRVAGEPVWLCFSHCEYLQDKLFGLFVSSICLEYWMYWPVFWYGYPKLSWTTQLPGQTRKKNNQTASLSPRKVFTESVWRYEMNM